MLKQAGKHDLAVQPSDDFASFMAIEERLLRTRHNARPTHNAQELAMLAGRFPENIRLFAASRGTAMLAGVVIDETARVARTQHIVPARGRGCGALDLIFRYLIEDRYAATDHFDFGTPNEDNGRYLNEGLIKNKESYGVRAMLLPTRMRSIFQRRSKARRDRTG